MSSTPTPTVQTPTISISKNPRWDKSKPFVGILLICALDAYIVFATKLQFDLLTGVALITLLFMMLQTEHERCDRVRSDWREVRKASFALTSAVQWARKKQTAPDGAQWQDEARASLQEFYRTLLLYGKGSLREEYQKELWKKQQAGATLVQILTIFPALDLKAERKFKSWTLVSL